eukprot:TCALIF_02024-PA protein Name:"Similar to Nach Sodium channel protein Nach (Drosophila melanogaster)" AED:0.08 eAED:0.09 QI:38/0.85/0.37/1/0.28/0.5/8/0/589
MSVPRAAMYQAPKKDLLLKRQAKEYCGAASIHGLTYIAEEGRPIWENLLWVFLCIASAVVCVLLCLPIWNKWKDSPTYTTVSSTNFPVWEIDFPAFTVCSNEKIILKNLEHIYEKKKTDDKTASGMLDILTKYVKFVEDPSVFQDFYSNQTGLFKNNTDPINGLLRWSMHSCEDMLLYCEWQGIPKKCDTLFKVSKSDNGFCCSFNIVTTREQFETADTVEGSSNDSFTDYYYEIQYFDETNSTGNTSESGSGGGVQKRSVTEAPKSEDTTTAKSSQNVLKLQKTNSASTLLGLTVILKPSSLTPQTGSELNVNIHDYDGYKFLVHDPREFPEVTGKGLALLTGNVAYMAIKGRKCIQGGSDLQTLEITEGVKMEVFQNYTRANCLLECRAHLMQKTCQCLPYYFPDFTKVWNKNTECDLEGLECLAKEAVRLNALNVGDKKPDRDSGLLDGASCNCPIQCEETIYNTELSQVKAKQNAPIFQRYLDSCDLESEKDSNAVPSPNCEIRNDAKNNQESLTIAYVYFKELGVLKYTRDELYSTIDVIAAFGGVIGLCLGFSFLSGAEFLYWFTLRMGTDVSRKKRSAPMTD